MNTPMERDEQDVLLTTKLSIPPAHPGLIARPRLSTLLDEGLSYKLTLLSAAAGFGKTTLLSAWSQAQRTPVAWVSLDTRDNDPTLFWRYVVASLETTIQPQLGKRVLPLLQAFQPPPLEVILTVLINAVATIPQDFVLILDEYQLIEAPPIHQALAFLLEHLPPQMHILLASRSEPPLPLARLRAGGQIQELRTNDLRFTTEETTLFLRQGARRSLSAEHIQALETRTEGWVTGLHLAALSLRGYENEHNLIATITGSNRYILEYLVEEVLSRQPEHIQRFLLQTSLLERLNGPLCDALIGQDNGQEILEQLEDANLFLVPFDPQRSWYRYHRLFAEVMLQRLQRTQADQVARLYQQACAWYQHNGFPVEAIETALRGQSYEKAAEMIKEISGRLMSRGETATLLGWIKALPAEIVDSHLDLCLSAAWARYLAVQFEAAETYIAQAEDLLERSQAPSESDSGSLEHARGEMAALRAVMAISRQDVPHALEFAQRALQQLAPESRGGRALVTWALGVAYWFNDNVEAACAAVKQSLALGQASDSPYAALNALGDLVQLQFAQGQLRQAAQTCQQGFQYVESRREQLPATNTIQIAYGELQREWNNLTEATNALTQGLEQDQQLWNLGNTLRGYIVLARVRQAQGEAIGAQEAIQRAEQLAQQHQLPHIVAIVKAYQARLQLQQGEIAAAIRWAQESAVNATDANLQHTREVEYLTLVRVQIAQHQTTEALRLLTRLLQAAEDGKRNGSAIEILVLIALVQEKQGQRGSARASLSRALVLAEPEGYIRIFADEDAALTRLLKQLLEELRQGRQADRPAPTYIIQLLNVFEPKSTAPSTNDAQPLVEPLSGRECEVLQLLANGSSNREIAETLIVSLGTIKKHLNNIFGKLGVTNRTQAVAQARSLGLIP